MFEGLSEKLEASFRRLSGQGKIREPAIQAVLRDVRSALLEADVHYTVAKDFIKAVKAKAIGADVLESLTPDQQFIKIVRDELVELLGGEFRDLDLSARPPVPIMLVGLQGAGKTTTTGKLAMLLKSRGREPMLVSTDVRRPAAMLQLEQLGERIGVKVFPARPDQDPVAIAREAMRAAEVGLEDTILLDTAGRLQIDDELMAELERLKQAVLPEETLLVADAMTGQNALEVAQGFDGRIGIDGVVLTKLDGDARGGGALSIKRITGKPIRFIGTGEKMEALEPFHPERMANRILGMGDVLSLIEKAEAVVDRDQVKDLERKLKRAEFTIEDFRDQLVAIRKMGSMESLIGMIPGMNKMVRGADLSGAEGELTKIQAIIDSMTRKERLQPTIVNGSRRKRIARGSGTEVADVNRFLKQYQQMSKMMKRMSRGGRIPQLGPGMLPG